MPMPVINLGFGQQPAKIPILLNSFEGNYKLLSVARLSLDQKFQSN